MKEIINQGPEEITENNVQYWCHHTKELKHSQVHKALQFIKYDCLRYIGFDTEFNSPYTFVCLPLNQKELISERINGCLVDFNKIPFPNNYNWTIYKIYKNGKSFECNCQGWQTKAKRGELIEDGANCSHILALFYAFKLKRFTQEAHNLNISSMPDPLIMESEYIQIKGKKKLLHRYETY